MSVESNGIGHLQEDEALLEKIRNFCLSLPDITKRLSHGAPTFYIDSKRSFVQYHNHHHGDGRIAVWCAAPDELQSTLVGASPEIFCVPAYIGHLSRIGLRLDRNADWQEIARALSDAYLTRASKKQKQQLMNNNNFWNREYNRNKKT